MTEFFSNGFFDWQYSGRADLQSLYLRSAFDASAYWGGFAHEPRADWPQWAVGPFARYEENPVFEPSKDGWDRGRFGGGVHNGSVVRHDEKFWYVYRGEAPIPETFWGASEAGLTDFQVIDYICDIGVATSSDGVDFERVTQGLFRNGDNADYSFEDVCLVRDGERWVLFCNRWNWRDPENAAENGVWIAVSTNLIDWTQMGLAFPTAVRMHRNAAVLQDPENNAVTVNGRYVMYLNDGLVAYSTDLLTWESVEISKVWPGGEGCFALTGHDPARPKDIVLFTGGHHSGNFYAIGEVLLSTDAPEVPIDWLDRPILTADATIPWEDARSAHPPYDLVSCFRGTVFFTGMTRFRDRWWMYYGGSEYYTNLARSVSSEL